VTLYLPNLSFVAVPKTATIAIERAFSPYATNYIPHNHDPVDVVKSHSNNPCVAVVRHPLRWIESYYKYLRFSPYFARTDSIWGIRSKSFEQFVWAYVKGQHMWPEPLRDQSSYVCRNGRSVEYLYRYDNLSSVVDHLSLACGAKINLEKHNVSPDVPLDISKEALAAFETIAKNDYDLYESLEIRECLLERN
jgi:hypothetical protein